MVSLPVAIRFELGSLWVTLLDGKFATGAKQAASSCVLIRRGTRLMALLHFDAGRLEDYGQRRYLPPVDQVLGPLTFGVISAPEWVDSYIVYTHWSWTVRRLEDCQILATGPRLTPDQVEFLRALIMEPQAHWHGDPVYRRRPPVGNFAFRLGRGTRTVDLLVDLQNPGWEFLCPPERQWAFHFAGREMARLAKALFPELASPHESSVWKQGAITALKRAQPRHDTGGQDGK